MARNRPKRVHPQVRKGAFFPFQTSVVCWIDLLGYGEMIAQAGFNPLHAKSKDALRRLRRFHEVVAGHSSRYFPTLVMNDGAVAYRDLSFRVRSVTHDFLVRAWDLFNEVNSEEAKAGCPGARLVLASGFRMRGRRAGRDVTNKQFQSIIRRFQARKISAEQAINEAASIRQTFDIVPQLQANFAFTKAYVAETSGASGGFLGPNFFVELILFETPLPSWIVLGSPIYWTQEKLRLHASFSQVLDIPHRKHVEGGPLGIRDGLQVAQHLADDPDVLRALRAAQKF